MDIDRVPLVQPEQPRAGAWWGGLDHGGDRGDPRVGSAQVLLDPVDLAAHRGESGRRLLVQAERRAEVLVDVGIDRKDGQALADQVAAEQRRERGLAAASLADECKLHCGVPLPIASDPMPVPTKPNAMVVDHKENDPRYQVRCEGPGVQRACGSADPPMYNPLPCRQLAGGSR